MWQWAGSTGQLRCKETRLSLLLFPASGGVSREMGSLLQDLEVTLSSAIS